MSGTDTTTTAEQNIAAIRAAYDAANAGDHSVLLGLWHEDITICTWTLHGGNQRILTKSDALGAFGVVAKLDAVKDEVVDARAIGDDIVSTVNRVHRKYGDIELTTEISCTFRFKDGKIYRMSEVCPQDFEEFWDATGLTE